MLDKLLEYDKNLFVYLNQLGIERYDAFWNLITRVTFWIPLFLLFPFLLYKAYPVRVARKLVFLLVLLAVCTITLTETVRNVVGRLRPSNTPDLQDLIRILQTPDNFSFFSGHAANSFAVTVFMVLLLRNSFKWTWVLFIWPVLFSLSRIYVGVHYPGDILAGAFVGCFMGFSFYRIAKSRILFYPAKS